MPVRVSRQVPIRPLRDFLATEVGGGIALVGAAAVAMLWANLSADSYERLWSSVLAVRLGAWAFGLDLRHLVNEALMSIFFLVVGLEIKRELVEGELRDGARRALPVFAALGGMVVPALIYVAVNLGRQEARGWGIPMATDIALAVGVMTLAGSRVRPSLKLFLLALAIVDDIGAILVIGFVYAGEVETLWLVLAAGLVSATVVLQRRGITQFSPYLMLGVGLWWSLYQGGLHAALAGVIMGLIAPTKPYLSPELIDQNELVRVSTVEDVLITRRLARSAVSVVAWLEHRLHPWTSYGVVPLFALANAGVSLSSEALRGAFASPVAWGVVAGLVVGKPLGILAASALAVRARVALLPSGISWADMAGAGLLAGIGFTVSVFIAELALPATSREVAKVGILAASGLAGIAGLVVLRRAHRAKTR